MNQAQGLAVFGEKNAKLKPGEFKLPGLGPKHAPCAPSALAKDASYTGGRDEVGYKAIRQDVTEALSYE